MRYNPRCGYDDENDDPPNQSQDYWIVTTPNGTEYRFGSTEDSEQMVLMQGYEPGVTCKYGIRADCSWGELYRKKVAYAGETTDLIPMAYRLDQVRDVYGNRMTYHYDEEPQGANERGVHLEWIKYGGNDVQGTPSLYLVEFTLEERRDTGGTDDTHDNGPQNHQSYSLWEEERIRSIRVCTCPSEGCVAECSDDDIISEYLLKYQTPGEWSKMCGREHESTLLAEIHQYGQGGKHRCMGLSSGKQLANLKNLIRESLVAS
jgi:hypothetical protein